jgi:eukaryotic-like serine/threonine-protein kinase
MATVKIALEPASATTPDKVGDDFAQYRIAGVLGRGGMGVVYSGVHRARGHRVAIKVMHQHLAADPVARARFLREGALGQLSHRNIVEVWEAGTHQGRPFIVMELIDGETLAARLVRDGRLTVERAVELFLPLLSAVAALHRAGIVHRDLKLNNVVLTRRESELEPVVLDFGIAKTGIGADDESSLTQTAALLGTLRYLSPEQMRSAKAASARSDQYALGVMLYECLTGQRPFSGESQYDLMHAILTAPLVPPSAHVPGLPPALDAVVLRAMSRRPADRFSDVIALGSALLAFGDARTWASWARDFHDAQVEPAATARDVTEADPPRRESTPGRVAASGVTLAARRVSRAPLWFAVASVGLSITGALGLEVNGAPGSAAPATAGSSRVMRASPALSQVTDIAASATPSADASRLPQAPPSATAALPQPPAINSATRRRQSRPPTPSESKSKSNPSTSAIAPLNGAATATPVTIGKDDLVNPFAARGSR